MDDEYLRDTVADDVPRRRLRRGSGPRHFRA
jgi:hypothetical protein